MPMKDYAKLAEELEVGEITLRDIVKELEKPARDPRDEMPKPILRTDVLEMKDLKEGIEQDMLAGENISDIEKNVLDGKTVALLSAKVALIIT